VPGFIPDDKLEEIRNASDIAAVVRAYVPLQRAGRRLKALCPFHQEKTPSFFVDPERQLFKCFGCGEGGDVFSFVMKRERVDFSEAVSILAKKAGITLPERGERGGRGESRAAEVRKTKLYEINAWAAEEVYHKWLLKSPEAEPAREYLKSRGFDSDCAKRFTLGFAMPGWDNLLEEAKRQKISTPLLLKAGLAATRSDGGVYDRFRGRLMFPIRDAQRRVVGFGARALDDSEPKYLNSPETHLFRKGRTLYALDAAAEAMRRERRAIVVEGYTDTIMAHKMGIHWTVAVLGTSLTRDHVRLLRRYVDEVFLVMDPDSAGQSSSDRSIQSFIEEEMPVSVVTLPKGMDPCDYLQAEGTEKFLGLLDGAEDVMMFKLRRAGIDSPEKFVREGVRGAGALEELLRVLGTVRNTLALEPAVKRVAQITGVEFVRLWPRLKELSGRRGGERRDLAERPRRDAEKELISVLLARPDLIHRLRERLEPAELEDPRPRTLLEWMYGRSADGEEINSAAMLGRGMDDDAREYAERLVELDEGLGGDYETWLEDLVKRIKERAEEKAVKAAMGKLSRSRPGDGPGPEEDERLQKILEAKRRIHLNKAKT